MAAAFIALIALLVAPTTALAAPGGAGAGAGADGTVHGGLSRPDYSYANAIRESVWVDTGFDADSDGRTDRVAADIIRPREPARAGRKIPVIMDASPYFACCGRGNESQRKTYDAQGRPVQFPLFYDNYFVPRGYAVVLVDLAGTNRSDGCADVGGRYDVGSAKAVVDWLNGRATGYSERGGGKKVKAGWTNGKVGMIGKSWDGTIANAVASTGVRGLKTIVPISAISSWYDYYFQQGAALYDGGPQWLSDYVESADAKRKCAAVQQQIVDGSPRNGDWTSFWQERDYTAHADKVRASVLLVHGKQDLNVRTKHFGQWWDRLAANHVERGIRLSQTGHVDPFDFRRGTWVDTLHRWFDHYLLGVRNGVEREPMGSIERTPDHWADSAEWPAAATRTTTVRPRPGAVPGLGTLGLAPAGPGSTESFTDDPKIGEDGWSANVDRPTPAKAAFTTGVLKKDLRLNGSGSVTLTAASSTTSAHLSAVLVDLGPARIRDFAAAGEGIKTLTTKSCWGRSTKGDSACYKDTAADTAKVGYTVFSRGWADLGHYGSGKHGVRLTPGKAYRITVRLAATDHVVPAGHRLALIVAGTDAGLLEPADTKPTVTVYLARSFARLPLVGGSRNVPPSATSPAATGRPLHGLPGPVLKHPLPGSAFLG
ncbi:Xaa-Pro dipeptidyl-peptidase [Wenjunlia tyrosinilytica]|nr:Xaa-Pro dipeptidyl-peptidase [Wenjunlia tyrosinilytica]